MGRVVKLLLIIESFKIRIDFHLKWHPFGVAFGDQRWDIRVNSWRLSSIIASTLFSQSVSPSFIFGVIFEIVENTEICLNILPKYWFLIGCGPNHLKSKKLTSECALVFTKNIKNAKFIKKFESESWFKSFFTPSCILNCIKMLCFSMVWLICYAFIPITWQVQTWVSSGFKGIWFQISKVKFF